MGRNIPVGEITSSHPTLSLALFVTWMTVLVAVISSLCGIWPKKGSKSSATQDEKKKTTTTTETTDHEEPATSSPTSKPTNNNEEDDISMQLKPPPSKADLGDPTTGGEGGDVKSLSPPRQIDKSTSLQYYMSKNKSRRKLSASISMRMPMKIKDKAAEIAHNKKLKHEDSLWTKRIMLGEKCRLPNDEDEAVIYDEKGNRVLAYSQSRKAMSRSCSFIDRDVGSSSVSQEEKLKDKDKGKEICSDAES